MRRTKKKNPPHRVTPAIVPKSRAWMLDCDYWDKLSAEEKAYLAQFHDEYYRADFRYEQPMHDTPELERDRYAMQNSNHRDVYSKAQADGTLLLGGAPDVAASAESLNAEPLPRFLSSEEYKAAVIKLRALTDIPKRKRTAAQERRIAVLQQYIGSLANAATED